MIIGRPAAETAAADDPSGLGQVPEIAAIAGLGLVLVAVGDTLGRSDASVADLFFWVGLLAVVGPGAWRLLGASASGRERLGLVVLMGMALYVVKVLHSPIGFTLYDELQHLRTFDDIAASGGLYARNPLLLVGPLYPGLEIVTSVLTGVTGSGPFESAIVIVAAARLLLTIGLFLFLERATDNARIAGIGAFVYVANPNNLFFDSQFGYQSLAIGLGMIVFYLVAESNGRWREGAAGALLVAAASIVTHHATSYALVIFLLAWTVARWLLRSDRSSGPGPGRVAILTAIGTAAWLIFVASETVRYLGPRLIDGFAVIRLLLGDMAARQLFAPVQGALAPAWEQVVGYSAVILLLIALPLGLWRVWRDHRRRPIAVVLAIVALSYPATLALRLTQAGGEEASRSSTFVFLGLGFVVALAVAEPWSIGRRWRRSVTPVLAAAAMVVFVGGVIIGTPRWSRLPGPYLPAADTRSIGPESIDAALWARNELGPGKRIVADRVDRVLMGSYGGQTPVTNYGDEVQTFRLFFTPSFSSADLAILKAGEVQFLVVDRRLAGIKPLTKFYFENGEPTRIEHQTILLTLAGLTKFAQVPGVSVVFDSGNIQVYDVRTLTQGAPS
ncbi:MAG: hypothetical protein ABI555_02125 [Chloroflexota bacterium]